MSTDQASDVQDFALPTETATPSPRTRRRSRTSARSRRARPRRLLLAAAGASLLALAAPAAAGAATFHVDDDVAASGDCLTSATACKTIGEAITLAAAPGDDTIEVAPGAYPERVNLAASQLNGTTIQGAGTSADPTVGTVITRPAHLPHAVAIGGGAPTPDRLTLRDLRVVSPPTASQAGVSAIHIQATNSALERVVVDQQSNTYAAAIWISRGPATLDRVVVQQVADGGAGIYAQPFHGESPLEVTIRDSEIVGAGGAPQPALDAADYTPSGSGSRILVERTRLRTLSPTGATVRSQNTGLTLDSTLVTGGFHGLFVSGTAAGNFPVTLRNVTVDAASATGYALQASASGGATVPGRLESTIALDPARATGSGASLVCEDSDTAPGQLVNSATGACAPGVSGNVQSAAADLFVDAAAGDFRLVGGSPAVDTGSAAPLGGASSTDLNGDGRVGDGDGDGTARLDKGAFEYQRRAPTVSASASLTSATVGQPIGFSATGSDPDGDPLTYAWGFDDGGSATGAAVQHAFATPGTHAATVTVTDAGGRSASASVDVTVAAAPVTPEPEPEQPDVKKPDVKVPVDTVVPTVSLRLPRQRLRRALARGVRVVVKTSEAGRATVRLTLPRATAKRLRLRAVVATVRRQVRAGTTTVTLKLSRKARKRLARARKVKLTASATVTDAAGNAGSRRRAFKLKR